MAAEPNPQPPQRWTPKHKSLQVDQSRKQGHALDSLGCKDQCVGAGLNGFVGKAVILSANVASGDACTTAGPSAAMPSSTAALSSAAAHSSVAIPNPAVALSSATTTSCISAAAITSDLPISPQYHAIPDSFLVRCESGAILGAENLKLKKGTLSLAGAYQAKVATPSTFAQVVRQSPKTPIDPAKLIQGECSITLSSSSSSGRRCSARMEGSFRTVDSIKRTITISVRRILDGVNFIGDLPFNQAQILHSFNLQVSATRKAPILVKWVPPSSDYSLNVDGASKGNPGINGGGGCVRDSRGNLLCAFAFSYGIGSSIVAESRAIHDGLRLSLERHYPISVLYSDSAVILRAISVGQAPHWAVFPWWRGICDMIRILNPKLVHTYREGNQVADSLANMY
ncbi:hypothetical protein Taro_002661 [Colocasia esculenta]|uniref:RNase H type-1 domain-containing protein n=1 Tax=Colocasia esculenta TaxID=4460 RepID=A0A843THP9_COLES|nr:hypothetical protein [Colocasia esculenta]